MDTPFDITRLWIRPETTDDVHNIGCVTAKAFAPMPFGDGTEAQLIETLRASGALAVSLVATMDAELVGHIAFSPVMIDDLSGTWYQLSPLSVAPPMQNRGVGSALITSGLNRLRTLGAGGCVLTGNPDYYSRSGFLSNPTLTYQGRPNKYFQRLVLNGAPMSGDVRFHPAFDES